MFLLKRLQDAEKDGDKVLGVIRGVGLCNDGRARGLLVPSSEGQVRAMQLAYKNSGLLPQDISYVECHATGTSVGDSTEIRSMKEVYGDHSVHIASLKSNMGHLITAAGSAGLLKVLGAFEHDYLPPTLHCDQEIDILKDSNFHLLRQGQNWTEAKRAAVSAFGFGGNNAHLIVESYEQYKEDLRDGKVIGDFEEQFTKSQHDKKIAIVGLDIAVGTAFGKDFVQKYLVENIKPFPKMSKIPLQLTGIKFPPNDLKQALPQQTILMELARRTLDELPQKLQNDKTAVWIAMGCDTNVCRYGARWRMAQHQERLAEDGEWLQKNREAVIEKLSSAGVLGTMPNISTNRLNSQFDLQGLSSSISAEESSATHALQCAIYALQRGEIQSALVGAVDFTCDDVHMRARRELGLEQQKPLDAASVVVLKEYEQACCDNDVIWGTVSMNSSPDSVLYDTTWGDSHAASMLTEMVMACLSRERGSYCIQKTDMLEAEHRFYVESYGRQVSKNNVSTSVLQLPSHWKEVQLPPSKMPRATNLTPVVDIVDEEHHLHQSTQESSVSPQNVLDDHFATEKEHISNTDANDDMLFGVHVEHHSTLTHLHEQFLAQQNQIHQQFLEHQQFMQHLLFERKDEHFTTSMFQENVSQNIFFQQEYVQDTGEYDERNDANEVRLMKEQDDTSHSIISEPEANIKDLGIHQFSEMAPSPVGMTLDYEGLQIHSSGLISKIYGPQFVSQDSHVIQTRMPEPPLLLAHRMTGLQGEPVSMGKGTIWTESDVLENSWYLHVGRMPAGIMIESGQADLMLISYLGIDVITDGDRAYRLLGCELMYHDDLPQVGDTLCYDIHVDGHAKHGDVRLFFFHYDCRINGQPRLTVREGQAGFFTTEELANSAGIIWTPEEQILRENPVLDAPLINQGDQHFSFEQIQTFSQGNVSACFGPEFYLANTHTRTPTIAQDTMLFLRGDLKIQPKGGVWGRGYLRCEVDIHPDDWFFEGHFKNDPCMPGTLMFEGCLQAMAFFLASQGHTVERDGWRFQPMRHRPYPLRCRGQVTPQSKKLIYEIFVEEICAGPIPYLIMPNPS
jgi:3-hydroxymyristoyl/3-hydroxydecanoyl-(acyl carrier protein) dehydratase